MNAQLEKAISLRAENRLLESNRLLLELVKTQPENALVHYQCAWSFDVLGKESEAVPYYEKAISLGLSGADLEGALLGLGSTYRTLGNYEKSKETFEKGLKLFPNNQALRVFYAMTLYNLNQPKQAMELLLNCLIETTFDEKIKQYERAIRFYADKLDQVWDE
jgi:tetratricopeptide (TPR) repeat protein